MKKEQVLNLMNAIEPDLIEEADLQAPAKRRMPKIARTGLIAACLCLALLGTAFAANPEAMNALIERLTIQVATPEGNRNPGYSVTGGPMTKYPLSAFSPALNAASEGRENPASPVSLTFDTWDEVREFLGKDIPCTWPEDWDGDFQVLLFHTETDVLWGIDIDSIDYSRQTEIYVEVRTELWRGENASTGAGFPYGSVTQLSSYPMSNGCEAEVVQVTNQLVSPDGTPSGHMQNCFGHFMRSGILYTVIAYSPVPPQESTEAQLKTVLDSFP